MALIAHYYLTPQQNPYILARQILNSGGIQCWDRHQKVHYDRVDDDTVFHAGAESYKTQDFLRMYNPNNRKDDKQDVTTRA